MTGGGPPSRCRCAAGPPFDTLPAAAADREAWGLSAAIALASRALRRSSASRERGAAGKRS